MNNLQEKMFQSPRSGKFVSDGKDYRVTGLSIKMFQSPRSGKFVSDLEPNTWVCQS